MMRNIQSSRRAFLRSSALLTISSILLPAVSLANVSHNATEANPRSQRAQKSGNTRADIRSLDFDSHAFRSNFKM